jgi:hypothetical protein
MSQVEVNRCRNSTHCLERDRNICCVLQFSRQLTMMSVVSTTVATLPKHLFDVESSIYCCRWSIPVQCRLASFGLILDVLQEHTVGIDAHDRRTKFSRIVQEELQYF